MPENLEGKVSGEKENSCVYFCFFHSRLLNNCKQTEGEQKKKKNHQRDVACKPLSLLSLGFFIQKGWCFRETAFNVLARSYRKICQHCPANKAAREKQHRWMQSSAHGEVTLILCSKQRGVLMSAFVTRHPPTSLQTELCTMNISVPSPAKTPGRE